VDIKNIKIQKPENVNFILGQSHFIKSVEDIHEALVTGVPGIKFGLAFCEASGECLVRWSGTDDAMIALAKLPWKLLPGILSSFSWGRDFSRSMSLTKLNLFLRFAESSVQQPIRRMSL